MGRRNVNDQRFDGRVALVTGGSSGIGAAVAGRLLREGAKVATLDLAEGGPLGALSLTGDVRSSQEILAAVERAEAELGALSILVCSAGITGDSPLITTIVDDAYLERPGPQLEVVANYGVGVNNIDLDAALRRGIVVANTPDVLTKTTAELAIAVEPPDDTSSDDDLAFWEEIAAALDLDG